MMDAMNFVTLHELAVDLDKPEKVLRYQFKNLIRKNLVQEGVDFIKDGFRDEQHFIYKINPVSFMKLTGLSPTPTVGAPNTPTGTNTNDVGTKHDEVVTNIGTSTGTKDEEFDTKVGYQERFVDTKPPARQENIVVTPNNPPDPITLRLISTLEEQLRIKDGQIKDYREELREQQNVTNMAMGEIIKLNQQMRLSAGTKRDDLGTKVGTNEDGLGYQSGTKHNPVGNNGYQNGYQSGTKPEVAPYDGDPTPDNRNDRETPRFHPQPDDPYSGGQ